MGLKISKLDAVRRQLETAVRLYFAYGDPVSIHTLSAAAYNVVQDINSHKEGLRLIAKDRFLDYIKEGHEKEVRTLINSAENFFKHADRDHESTLDFNPAQTDFLTFEASVVYRQLSGENPPLLRLYEVWFISQHPNLFKFKPDQQRAVEAGSTLLSESNRVEFFNKALPFFMKPHA